MRPCSRSRGPWVEMLHAMTVTVAPIRIPAPRQDVPAFQFPRGWRSLHLTGVQTERVFTPIPLVARNPARRTQGAMMGTSAPRTFAWSCLHVPIQDAVPRRRVFRGCGLCPLDPLCEQELPAGYLHRHSSFRVPCDDQDACTVGDTCQNGLCMAGSSLLMGTATFPGPVRRH